MSDTPEVALDDDSAGIVDPALAESVCRELLMYRNLCASGMPEALTIPQLKKCYDAHDRWEAQFDGELEAAS